MNILEKLAELPSHCYSIQFLLSVSEALPVFADNQCQLSAVLVKTSSTLLTAAVLSAVVWLKRIAVEFLLAIQKVNSFSAPENALSSRYSSVFYLPCAFLLLLSHGKPVEYHIKF